MSGANDPSDREILIGIRMQVDFLAREVGEMKSDLEARDRMLLGNGEPGVMGRLASAESDVVDLAEKYKWLAGLVVSGAGGLAAFTAWLVWAAVSRQIVISVP